MGKNSHFSISLVLHIVEMLGSVVRHEGLENDPLDKIIYNSSGRYTDLKCDTSLRDQMRLRLNGFVDVSSMMKDYCIKGFNEYEEPVASLYGFIISYGYKCGISNKTMETIVGSASEMHSFIIALVDDVLEWIDHRFTDFRKSDPRLWEQAYQWAFAYSLHVGRVITAKDKYDAMVKYGRKLKFHMQHLIPVFVVVSGVPFTTFVIKNVLDRIYTARDAGMPLVQSMGWSTIPLNREYSVDMSRNFNLYNDAPDDASWNSTKRLDKWYIGGPHLGFLHTGACKRKETIEKVRNEIVR